MVFPHHCDRCGEEWPEFFNVPDDCWHYYVVRLGQGEKLLCVPCYQTIVNLIDGGAFASQHGPLVMQDDMRADAPLGSPGRVRWEELTARNKAIYEAQQNAQKDAPTSTPDQP